MILRKIDVKNTTIELNRPEAAIVPACRNNVTALNRSVRTIVLPAKAICAREAAGFGDAPARESLAPRKNLPRARNAGPCPVMPWRCALLEVQGSFVEKAVYVVLTATVAVSLLMAFWQLRNLDAGWTAFVDLVGRILS